MALDQYKWFSQIGSGAIQYRDVVRTAQFGDGYEQVANNGINSVAIEIPMKHTGRVDEVDEIRAFLLAHTVKAFAITPPGEVLGLYRVVADSIQKTSESKYVATLTFTIRRAYGVFA